MKRPSLVRTSLVLLAAQVVFRGGDAALPLLLAMWFGRSSATDVYFFSWAAFAFAGSLVFSVYQDSAIVPILTDLRVRGDRDELAAKTRGSLLAHTLVLGGALSAVIGMLAVGTFAMRYDGADLALAAKMVPLFCLYLVALSVRTFLVAVLNAEHRYLAHPMAGAASIAVTIGMIAALHRSAGMLVVPAAALAGELVSIGILGQLTIGNLGLKMPLTFERPEPVMRFVKLAASETGGGALTRINPVFDQLMAGFAAVMGGGTLLRYSSDVSSVLTSLLQASLLPVLLSVLSQEAASAGRDGEFRGTVNRSLAWSFGLLAAASALVYAIRGPLLRAVFLRGEMDAGGVDRMIEILPYHLVGIAPFGALLVLARAHVALKNSRIMLSMGVLNASLNILFDVALVKPLGLRGLALSTSLTHTAVAVVFWLRLESALKTSAARASVPTIREEAA
ncbi:MAG TPA: lipid II flippase MurJ [Polyangiaceae bacterium]